MSMGQAQDLPLQGWCRRASVGATLVVARCVENTAHGHLSRSAPLGLRRLPPHAAKAEGHHHFGLFGVLRHRFAVRFRVDDFGLCRSSSLHRHHLRKYTRLRYCSKSVCYPVRYTCEANPL